MIIVSSPGKIHLLGEHAVVYGRPAVLAAIDKRVYVGVKTQGTKNRNKRDLITVINNNHKDEKLLREAIDVFQKTFGIKDLPPIEISVSSNIAIGSGLGSSAALAAATIGALMKFVKNIWNPFRINELAYEVEKKIHGNPSGADNTTVVFGGLVWFRREFDFLKSIWSLPVSSYKIPPFILIDSGRPKETTGEMVGNVAKLYKRNKKKMEEIFVDQEKQTKNLLLALREGKIRHLINTIRNGQRNLEKIGVVSAFAQKIIREIEKRDGAAKISGAGGIKEGSGMILCYHKDLTVVKKVGEGYNLPFYDIKLGGEGIRLENGREKQN